MKLEAERAASGAADEEVAELALAVFETAMKDWRRSRSFSDMNSNTDFALDVKAALGVAAGIEAVDSPNALPRCLSV